MADLLTLTWEFKLEVAQVFDIANPDLTATHDQDGSTGIIKQDSTPISVLDAWSAHRVLSASADSLDLTALAAEGNLAVRDFTGKKILGIKVIADSNPTNTEPLTFQGGASNPYELCGNASWFLPLPPGGVFSWISPTELADQPAVSGTAKAIDVASAQATPGYTMVLVAGT